jgi:hypothetical protein
VLVLVIFVSRQKLLVPPLYAEGRAASNPEPNTMDGAGAYNKRIAFPDQEVFVLTK